MASIGFVLGTKQITQVSLLPQNLAKQQRNPRPQSLDRSFVCDDNAPEILSFLCQGFVRFCYGAKWPYGFGLK